MASFTTDDPRWAWLVALEPRALELLEQVGVSRPVAEGILEDPVGWAFDEMMPADGSLWKRTSEGLAEVVIGALLSEAYSDNCDAIEDGTITEAEKKARDKAAEDLDTERLARLKAITAVGA